MERNLKAAVETEIELADPLAWLKEDAKEIRQSIEEGFTFWQVELVFPAIEGVREELRSRVAFLGDSEVDFTEAGGHTIYVENDQIVPMLTDGRYDEDMKAWEVQEHMYFAGGNGRYSLEDGRQFQPYDDEESDSPGFNLSVDSDVAEKALLDCIQWAIKDGAREVGWLRFNRDNNLIINRE